MPARNTSVIPEMPPEPKTLSGRARRVGVEIEFANLAVPDAARLVRAVFGGELVEDRAHRAEVRGGKIGDFTIELDARLVHEGSDKADAEALAGKLKGRAREALGYAIAGVVPTEIVCPPLPWQKLGRLDALFDALRRGGAEGTMAAPLYGFGLHLNPEIAQDGTGYVLRHLQAYLLLEDRLREAIGLDPARRLLPFVDPFPDSYMELVLDPEYAPGLRALIRDYVRANPTRNRGLDMMPLFRHLDADTLLSLVDDATLIKARPTFHYRLPDCRLSDPSWSAVVEWNRWVRVEMLAADDAGLRHCRNAWLEAYRSSAPRRWLETVEDWFRR